jgi:hypothetical protein
LNVTDIKVAAGFGLRFVWLVSDHGSSSKIAATLRNLIFIQTREQKVYICIKSKTKKDLELITIEPRR